MRRLLSGAASGIQKDAPENAGTKRPRFRHNAGGSLAYRFPPNRGDAMWNTIKTDIMLLAMGLAAVATVFGAELGASDIWSLLNGAN